MSDDQSAGADRYGRVANNRNEFRTTGDGLSVFDDGLALGSIDPLEIELWT